MATRPAFTLNPSLMFTSITWGLNFVALKIIYTHITPASLALVRFAIMYLVLVLICRVRKESVRYAKEDVARLLFLGFVSLGVYIVLFMEGMNGTSSAECAIILATGPIFTAMFAILAGQERFSVGALIGALIAFAGTAMVILFGVAGHQSPAEGHARLVADLLVLLSSIVWAYGTTLMRPLWKKYSPVQALTLSMPGGLLVLLPYGIVSALHTQWGSFTTLDWWILLYVSAFSGALGFTGFYDGVRKIGPAAAMLYQYFVPGFAALFAYLLLGTPLTAIQASGLALIILGVALASRARFRTAEQLEPAS